MADPEQIGLIQDKIAITGSGVEIKNSPALHFS
jgi:hypothetical protein